MDHGGHGGHGGHDMPDMTPMCKMNMLWNTDIIDTCIVFRSWRISSNAVFFWSCMAIVALGIFYEYLRVLQRKLDYHIALSLSKGKGRPRSDNRTDRSGRASPAGSSHSAEESGLLSGQRILNTSSTGTPVPTASRALRAAVYGFTVFLSFFLMLVFMTYNAYLIAAVVVGATIGHYIFGSMMNVESILLDSSAGKGMACH